MTTTTTTTARVVTMTLWRYSTHQRATGILSRERRPRGAGGHISARGGCWLLFLSAAGPRLPSRWLYLKVCFPSVRAFIRTEERGTCWRSWRPLFAPWVWARSPRALNWATQGAVRSVLGACTPRLGMGCQARCAPCTGCPILSCAGQGPLLGAQLAGCAPQPCAATADALAELTWAGCCP